jgi:hypothetical protein
MSEAQQTQRWISNYRMRLALEIVEELLGRNGRTAVLRLADLERYIHELPPANDRMEIPRGDVTALFSGIASTYGDQGSRGVFRRWGHAFADRQLQGIGLRLWRMRLRLIPAERRAAVALERLLPAVGLVPEKQTARIEEQDTHLLLQLSDTTYCYGQKQGFASCLTVVGVIEHVLHWATGADYNVYEQPSTKPGCVFLRIDKTRDA